MKKSTISFIVGFGLAILAQLAGVSFAAANPPALGGTGTAQVPTSGNVLIGNGSGNYTSSFLTAGANIQITNGSGTVTIAVTGTATGTVYMLSGGHGISLSPGTITTSGTIAINTSTLISDVTASGNFLPSSTVYVATVNGLSGAVTLGIPATTTINGTQATVFKLIGDGTTVTSTVNGTTTTFSVIPNTFYPYSSNPSNYLTGNQNITLKITGDATGTAIGATSITDSLTITGLQGKALPALSTGTLQYTGGAWTFNNNTYLLSGINVTTTAPLGGGGVLTGAGLTLTCATCLTGNQTITLTGAVSGSGATSIATTYNTSTLYGFFSAVSPIVFNTSTGQFSWTNSNGYISSISINGNAGTAFQIVGGSGITSSVSGATTTITLNLGTGCSGGNFVQTISPTGTITCATPSGGASSTNVFGTGGVNVTQVGVNATASINEAFTNQWSALQTFNAGITMNTSTLPSGYDINALGSNGSSTGGTQIGVQNTASTSFSEFTVTADTGTTSTNYGGLGINNSNNSSTGENPIDTYVEGTNGLDLEPCITGSTSSQCALRVEIGGNLAGNIKLQVNSTTVQLGSSTNLDIPSLANDLVILSSTGTLQAYTGTGPCAAGQAMTTLSGTGGQTCAAFGSSNVATTSLWSTGNIAVVSSSQFLASFPASSTAIFYVDGNRTDSYTQNGSFLFPYKTLPSAITACSGFSACVFNLSPDTYVDGSPDTFPNVPFYISGNESTLVEPSGVTMPNAFDIYDLTIVGNVTEADTSTAVIHQFNNGTIVGNLSLAGNATLEGMAFPVTTSTITVQKGALTNIAGSFIQGSISVAGVVNLNDDQLQTGAVNTSTLGWGLYASSTGAQVIINGMTGLFLNPNLQGIYVNDGATSSPNVISNFNSIVETSTVGATVNAGTAATILDNGGPLVNALTGQFVAPSGTAWVSTNDETRAILNALSVGTSTVTSGDTILNDTVFLPGLTSLNCLGTNSSGQVGAGTCTGGSSTTNVFGTNGITVTQVGANATTSINESYANQWLALQSFVGGASINTTTLITPQIGSTSLTLDNSPLIFTDGVSPNDTYALFGRTISGFPVPYFTPTATNTNIAFDVFPHGANGGDGGPGNWAGDANLGVAWEDICNNDVAGSGGGSNYECLHLGISTGTAGVGYDSVSSEQAGSGVVLPLVLQDNGGNVGVGQTNRNPTSTLAVSGTLFVSQTSTLNANVVIPNTINGTLASSLASSSVTFEFQNATTTAPAFQTLITSTKRTISYVDCGEYAAATTTIELGYATTTKAAIAGTIGQVILASLSCGNAGNSTTSFTTSTLPIGSYLITQITATAGTPQLTTVDLEATKL